MILFLKDSSMQMNKWLKKKKWHSSALLKFINFICVILYMAVAVCSYSDAHIMYKLELDIIMT